MTNMAYCRPYTIKDAVSLLTGSDNCKILAGGTDVVVQLKEKKISPDKLIDISYITALNNLEFAIDGTLRIGAAVPLARLAEDINIKKRFPLLSQAARTVGSNQIRQRATLAGNLCNSSPSADTIPALLVLEAKISIVGPEGLREVAAEEFITGPGTNVLQAGEMVQGIIIPALPPYPHKSAYLKFSRRGAVDLATVGVAVLMIGDPGNKICHELRLALGAVAPVPFRAREVERLYQGKEIYSGLILEAARLAKKAARPISDIRATATYRLDLVEAMVGKGISDTWDDVNRMADRITERG